MNKHNKIIYFVDNKMGGVQSLNSNLSALAPDIASQLVIHIHCKESEMAKGNIQFQNATNISFEYSNKDNSYFVIKGLRALVPDEDGAIVVNYELEMEMLDHYHVKQTVFQLVHDEYNIRLTERFGHVVDIFIAHNKFIFNKLQALLPERVNDIYYLPHGVKIPSFFRKKRDSFDRVNPLKLLFLGRITKSKGVFDLPLISEIVSRKTSAFTWTIIGNGPDKNNLMEVWNDAENVKYLSPNSNEELLSIIVDCDIFVFPTKFEGTPVALLETMSVGVVPIATNLPGGVSEIVSDDIGFLIEVDDNQAFANAILYLMENPFQLNFLSNNCRQKICNQFDLVNTSSKYHELFRKYSEFYHTKFLSKSKIGARLDQAWIPPLITRILRALHSKI